MPRRCASCGEPGGNVAAFCGRCGARGDHPRAVVTARRGVAGRASPRRAVLPRIGLRQAVACATTLAVLGVLASGLELDRASGSVTVPPAASDQRASLAVDGPDDPAAPPAPPDLVECAGTAATPLCWSWRHPRRHDQLVLADARAVYLGGADGGMVALDRGTGKVRWFSPPDMGVVSEAAIGPEGLVVAVDGPTPALSGLDPGDGTLRWSVPASSAVELRSAAGPGHLFEPDGLRSIDPVTGVERWAWRTEDPAGVELVPGTGDIPVVVSSGRMTGLEPLGGTVRWELPLPALRGVAPAGHGRLVAVDGDGGLVGVDAGSGVIRWQSRLAFGDRSGVRLWSAEDLLVVVVDPPLADDGTRTPRVVGVDPASGAVRWVHLYRSSVERRGIVLEPTAAILVGTTSAGTIASLDLGTGGIAWQRDLGEGPAHVRIVGDRVLAASGRDIRVLSAVDGSVEAVARSPSPVIGIVDAAPGSAVLRTSTEVVSVALPTGG